MNFFELEARERVEETNVWMKLERMIDWDKIRERLKGLLDPTENKEIDRKKY